MSRYERSIPKDIDAEKALLSSVLQRPDILDEIEPVQIARHHFCDPVNATIFAAVLSARMDGVPVDFVTMLTRMTASGEIERCGGPAYLSDLWTFVPSAANWQHYAVSLEECRVRREQINLARSLEDRAFDLSISASQTQEWAERAMVQISDAGAGAGADNALPRAADAVDAQLAAMEDEILDGTNEGGSVRTGIAAIDECLGGLRGGRIIALAARPGTGKTALVETMVDRATRDGHAVVVFQRDMSVEDMIARMACRAAGVPLFRYERRQISHAEIYRVREALADLRSRQHLILMRDPARLTVETLRGIVRRDMAHGARGFILDHIQLLDIGGDMREGLTRASNEIRKVVRETGAFSVIVAQLNRDADKVAKPHPGQIKEFDQLFADSDATLLLWPDEDPAKVEGGRPWRLNLSICKTRFGVPSDETLYLDRRLFRFVSDPLGGSEE